MTPHLALCDGGPDIGYGHLVRSRALAEAVIARGGRVTVATTTPDVAETVFPGAAETVALPDRDDPEPFVSWLTDTRPDVVFTDAYPVDTDYQRRIHPETPLVVMQDDARHTVCADAFVNGNLYADALSYEFDEPISDTYLGPKYLLLREDIRRLATGDPPWRPDPERALVTMGGGDTANLTPTVIRAFDSTGVRVDAIVGPGCSDRQETEIRRIADKVHADVRVAHDPEDLPTRMFKADFAVSTASTTTYELFALGTPVVCLPVADNQEPIAEALTERDGALVLSRDAGASPRRGHCCPLTASDRPRHTGARRGRPRLPRAVRRPTRAPRRACVRLWT